jgi:hypothetical protein
MAFGGVPVILFRDMITNESKGLKNKLARQIGEYLVCAELGRRGLIATPFAGNVPAFDIVVADDLCRSIPIQVKASRFPTWPGNAQDWMKIAFNPKTQKQTVLGKKAIQHPDLICVFVVIAPSDSQEKDRFFLLTKAQLQGILTKGYSGMLANCKIPGRRPRKPESYDCRPWLDALLHYENNWQLVSERLARSKRG